VGLFLLNNLNKLNNKNINPIKFKIKKKLFSFLFPNEIKNNFLKFKKSITLYSAVYKLNFVFNKNVNSYYQLSNLSNLYNKLLRNVTASKVNSLHLPSTNNFLYKKQHKNLRNTTYFNTSKTLNTFENIGQNKLENSLKANEIRIPRVRFRPGYQRLWRQARGALKDSLGLNFTYQKQLTKYLTQFFK
tara:strand:+ start:2512 stop:3075 length:564 start_codon:yes stop_codon:yes gene_type:complete